mmetsp:Transcript_11832/g.32408  ORF Transcript_11832/g.32408 Transcript_11832/m.32408 type:complete len:204 (+) Transcript_11832:32-643(+)
MAHRRRLTRPTIEVLGICFGILALLEPRVAEAVRTSRSGAQLERHDQAVETSLSWGPKCGDIWKRRYGEGVDCRLSASGYEVVFGLSSKANDIVSMEIAKDDEDYMWLHADDGIPGSHVVIRAPWDEVDAADVVLASRIAATNAQFRASGRRTVPVMYCRSYQVNKLKGAPPGEVVVVGQVETMEVDVVYTLSVTEAEEANFA